MRKFWQNLRPIQEDNGELEIQSSKLNEESTELKKSLAELECEEAIIEDKREFGR